MQFFSLLYKKEKLSLVTQLMESLNIIRDYLLDENLVLTNISKEYFNQYATYRGFPEITNRVNGGFEKVLLENLEKVCVLDPYGEYKLKENWLRRFKYFVIGGIVDMGNRLKGYTSKILPEVKHCRLEYLSSPHLVPGEINHIIQILLLSMFDGFTIEKAIEFVLPKRYKKRIQNVGKNTRKREG